MKKLRQMYKKSKKVLKLSKYWKFYYHEKLDNHMILIESKNGGDLAGNMFYILKEVCGSSYQNYQVYLAVKKNKMDSIKKQVASYNIQGVHFTEMNTRQYYLCLAKAKYLFTDTSFARDFVKKEGQIITNTWHGTPLKKMGRDVENRAYAMGNVQRNLLFSDYLIYPNDYMKEKMVDAYMLRGLYQGTILCEGYPRNSVFFDPSNGSHIRKELELEGKRVYMYMPTWRGTLTNKNTPHLLAMSEYYLRPLDKQLRDDQVFYVKMHPFVNKDMDYSKYKHIRPFPEQYDAYEFMNMCDMLITDYSSVFYDFANTKKKVILFAYDETEYLAERGLYVELSSLPFPVVKSVKGLVKEMNTPKNYDDTKFLKECCTYDGAGAAERICCHVIKGEKVCKEEKLPMNGKKNVVLYGSSLAKNGLTTSLLNLFDNIDLEKRNYYVSFLEVLLKKAPLRVSQIREEVGIIPLASDATPSVREAIAYVLYFKKNIDNVWVQKYLSRLFAREFRKHYAGVQIDYMIQFAGYEKKVIKMFQQFKGPCFIYVHNDMMEEVFTKGNQHYLTLRSAYREYDKVAVVTKDIVPPTVKLSDYDKNVVVVNNCHDYKGVREKAGQSIEFDPETKCTVSLDELRNILDSDAQKIINIGRFSAEKGHARLIEAFDRYYKENRSAYLIIIGGYGPLYNATIKLASQLQSASHIIIIRSMKNPMSVLKKCDLFILSSQYEGLGLTLLEADTIGIPTISTDIAGPQGFMREHGGYLVSPDVEGVYQGMKDFEAGKVKAMNVDYAQYNKNAVEQFEKLFQEYEA